MGLGIFSSNSQQEFWEGHAKTFCDDLLIIMYCMLRVNGACLLIFKMVNRQFIPVFYRITHVQTSQLGKNKDIGIQFLVLKKSSNDN